MDSFLRQYETGRKSLVEVLNTQRDLTETRLLFSQIKSEWLTLSLKLAAITGSLDELAGLIIYE
jgi:adhesin transport system outer membrane protein